MVKIGFSEKNIAQLDILIVPVLLSGKSSGKLPVEIAKKLSQRISDKEFTGKSGETVSEFLDGINLPLKVLFVGLGELNKLTPEKAKVAGAQTKEALPNPKNKIIGLITDKKILSDELFAKFVEGLLLKNYVDNRYKTGENKTELDNQIFNRLVIVGDVKPSLKTVLIRLNKLIEAIFLTRDLVSTPSADMKPHDLADVAEKLAKQYKNLQVKILNRVAIEKAGLKLLSAVNRGSHHEARLIIMKLNPDRREKPIILIGKGITFDSGGYNLKPSTGMETMHTDMAGAAAVIGAIKALAELNCKKPVIGIIPATENLVSGNSYKPADIIKSYNGLTVEIANTDAEGRLILADAIAYSAQFKPQAIIDLATLTGACIVALGERYAGLFSDDEKLVEKIKTASAVSGDKVWQLPLDEGFKESVKSKVADIANLAKKLDRLAGASTGAAFLSYFVPDKTPWAHLDIAGPSYQTHELEPWNPAASPATGFGVALLVEIIQNYL